MTESTTRPGGPKVFGILSIVFGSVALLFTLIGACASVAGQRAGADSWMFKGQPNGEVRVAAYKRLTEQTRVPNAVQTGVFSILSAALIAIGIGQLRYRGWARKLAIYWGFVALIALVLTAVLNLLIVQPANQAYFKELVHAAGQGSLDAAVQSTMGSWLSGPLMLVLTLVLYVPYPVAQLLYFSRARVRAAMTD